MRAVLFLYLGASAAKVYLTHGPQLWYNGVGIIIYKKSYMISMPMPHIVRCFSYHYYFGSWTVKVLGFALGRRI